MSRVQMLDKIDPRYLVHGPYMTGPKPKHMRKNWAFRSYSVTYICPSCEKNMGGLTTSSKQWTASPEDPYPGVKFGEVCLECKNPDLDPSTVKDIRRKVRIIAWLLPRFRKGLSDPKKYEELIGRVY